MKASHLRRMKSAKCFRDWFFCLSDLRRGWQKKGMQDVSLIEKILKNRLYFVKDSLGILEELCVGQSLRMASLSHSTLSGSSGAT